MRTKNYKSNGLHLIRRALICCFIALLSCSVNAQEANNANAECFPTFEPCSNVNVLDFSENGNNWGDDDMSGTYTVGDQTFEVNINDPDGIFGALQNNPEDADDIGSYANNSGLAIGINPDNSDEEIEITYNLSLVSDYVAFTIRDLDDKYKYGNSRQSERVCVFGYLDGVEVAPNITSLCGSVEVDGNCAEATADSNQSGEDESIRIVFESCINEIKVVYGNSSGAGQNPTYSKIYIGDDIGFGTAVCTDACTPCTAEGSEIILASGDGTICIDDSVEEPIDVAVTGGNGETSVWVITDQDANILALPDGPPFILDDAGEGTCLIWYLNYDGELGGTPEVGANAATIVGDSECAALSNPISITRETCCTAAASVITLSSGSDTICIDDEVDEPIDVAFTGGEGENSVWVITDQDANILALPGDPPFVLDGAGEGTCLIWYLNYEGDVGEMLEVGINAATVLDDSVCAELSNPIPITREVCCTAAAAEISIAGGDQALDLCVNDETLQPVQFEVSNPGSGAENAWVVTDENGVIIEIFNDTPSLDFYGGTEGVCLVWYLNWDGDLASVPQVGDSAGDLVSNSTCAQLSNPVSISKTCCCPYTIQFTAAELSCTSGNIFPNPILLVDTNLILPGDSLVCDFDGSFSPCSGEPGIRNDAGTVIAGAITMPGVYTATGCDCAEDVRLEVTQADLDGCVLNQQGIVAPTICNGGMIAEAPVVNSVFDNSATIQWNPQTNASLQYKATDSDQWISIIQSSGYVIIPNLGTCKEYEVRLNYPCGNNMINSVKQRFTTAGCVSCENIEPELVPLNVTDNSAILSWDVISGSMYTLYYKSDKNAEWSTYNTVVPFVILFGLDECSMYEFGLKVTCSDARTSNMSSVVEFGDDCGGLRTGDLVISDNSLINIYPNPASSFVDISLTNNSTISSIEIYNASGKLMFNQNDLKFDGAMYTAELTNLSKGLYFVTTVVDEKVHTKKFLKE